MLTSYFGSMVEVSSSKDKEYLFYWFHKVSMENGGFVYHKLSSTGNNKKWDHSISRNPILKSFDESQNIMYHYVRS